MKADNFKLATKAVRECDRSEGEADRAGFINHLRRIVAQFNEKDRKIRPDSLVGSRSVSNSTPSAFLALWKANLTSNRFYKIKCNRSIRVRVSKLVTFFSGG